MAGSSETWTDTPGISRSPFRTLPESLHRILGGGGAGQGHPLSYWRSLVREGVEEGQRNTTIASFAGHLFWRGIDPEVALELLLAWNRVACRPPLSDDEVARTVDNIARLHAREHGGDE